jgi:MFS family permease
MIATLLALRASLQSERRSSVSLGALGEGIAFVRSQRVVLSFMALDFGATFFGTANSLLPIYARDILQVGPTGLGLMTAAPSVGQVTTGFVMGSTGRVRRAGRWVLIGVTVYAVCICAFALSPFFPLSLAMLVGTGVGNGISAVLRSTSNNLLTPDHLRGRVAAVNSVFTGGGPQLGQFEAGMVAEAFGTVFSACSGGAAVLVLVAAIALVPEVRRFDLTAAIRALSEPPPARPGT